MSMAAYVAAFGGGVLSFGSPCVLPLVPVYLSMTTGLGADDFQSPRPGQRRTVLRGAGLFVVGFSVVFVGLGLSATALGATLARNQVPLARVGGALVIGMGLLMLIGTTRYVLAGRDLRFRPTPGRWGPWAAPVAGAAFAFGWTPCIGPVLGSVLTVAAARAHVVDGGLLLLAYSAGLAVPFLAVGLGFHRFVGALQWTRRHSQTIVRASGVLLVGYGALLVFDRLAWVTVQLQRAAFAAGLDGLVTLG